jgi:putative oxidoreductase
MRIATIIVRLLLGALLLFASISYFFHLMPEPEQTGNIKIFNEGIKASGYLMTLAKIVELLCGISFVSGKFMKLFAVILVPVTLNILLINVFMMPEGTPIAAALFLGNLFLIYTNWNSYKGIFVAN